MPCLIALLALATPRLIIVMLFLFSNWFKGMFDAAIWPVLGFFFLPATLLWYSAVQQWWDGTWNGAPQIIGLVIALIIDTSPAAGRRRERTVVVHEGGRHINP